MDGGADHQVEALGLLRVRQGNAPALFEGGGQDELLINLVVQVGGQQDQVVFVFLQGHLLGPEGQEHRQDDGKHQNDHEAGQGEKFYQAEGVQVFPRTPP